MAWTTPKTWANLDPLVASEFNTQFRDNLNALKAQTDDAETKMGQVYPTWQNPRMFRAVIGINQGLSITSSSHVIWHDKCKLTFTPQTDEVLFAAQFALSFNHNDDGRRRFAFGLRMGNAAVSLAQTDILSGSVGNTDDIALAAFSGRNVQHLVSYEAPIPVTCNVEVTIRPTVKNQSSGVTAALLNPSVMILTALDVGAYE